MFPAVPTPLLWWVWHVKCVWSKAQSVKFVRCEGCKVQGFETWGVKVVRCKVTVTRDFKIELIRSVASYQVFFENLIISDVFLCYEPACVDLIVTLLNILNLFPKLLRVPGSNIIWPINTQKCRQRNDLIFEWITWTGVLGFSMHMQSHDVCFTQTEIVSYFSEWCGTLATGLNNQHIVFSSIMWDWPHPKQNNHGRIPL